MNLCKMCSCILCIKSFDFERSVVIRMNHIMEEINKAETIAIVGHIRPDGDCVGSSMALYNYLKKEYSKKEVDIYLEFVIEAFTFLKNSNQVKCEFDGNKKYDLCISLDCGDKDRIGVAQDAFEQAAHTINIDHHISNTNFALTNYVESNASSTCEVLCHLLNIQKIDSDIAEALYLGIIYDTGVFKYSNTTKETLLLVGQLIEKGIPFSKIIDETFYQKTYLQNQILGRCLLESIMILEGKCVFSVVTQKMLQFYGASPKDLEGVIDQLRVTKGVEVAILIYEISSQEYKVSMRANGNIDVSKIAVFFGGGGHIKAAGCTMRGSEHDVINNLTAHIESQLEQI